MSIGDAASQLNVSVDTIRRRVRNGSIKAKRDARGQWWLDVPNAKPEPQRPAAEQRLVVGVGTPIQSVAADDDVIVLLRDQIADLRAERDRLLSMIDATIAAKR